MFGQHRLLDEQRPERRELRQDPAGGGGREAAVAVDRHVPVRAERVARRRRALRRRRRPPRRCAIGDIRPEAFIFTAVNPASTCAAICSASSAGSSPPTQAYTRTRSRTGAAEQRVHGAP